MMGGLGDRLGWDWIGLDWCGVVYGNIGMGMELRSACDIGFNEMYTGLSHDILLKEIDAFDYLEYHAP